MDSVEAITNGTPHERLQKISQIVSQLFEKSDADGLKNLTNHIMSDDSHSSLFARPVIHEITEQMRKYPDKQKDLGLFLLDKMQGQLFEEEGCIIRELLAEGYQTDQKLTEAARMLAGINFDSCVRYSNEHKAKKYVQIAKLFCAAGDFISADTYCVRAGAYILEAINDVETQINFKVNLKAIKIMMLAVLCRVDIR
eukprot:GHVL01033938.1.p1 GENE.GHVL01033938.1~~GHVL01033938.1.p1  ORF type:complete len:197 (+),score=29.76 GHVL01033938.1:121-711(+)